MTWHAYRERISVRKGRTKLARRRRGGGEGSGSVVREWRGQMAGR